MKKIKKDYRTFAHPIDRKHLTHRASRGFLTKNEDIMRISMHKIPKGDWPDYGCGSRNTWKYLDTWFENSVGRSETELWSKFKSLLRWNSKRERWYWWTSNVDDYELEKPRNIYYFDSARILQKYR